MRERRHLDVGQRAMAANKIANIRHGSFSGNQHSVVSAGRRIPDKVSQTQAAKQMKVGKRSVETTS